MFHVFQGSPSRWDRCSLLYYCAVLSLPTIIVRKIKPRFSLPFRLQELGIRGWEGKEWNSNFWRLRKKQGLCTAQLMNVLYCSVNGLRVLFCCLVSYMYSKHVCMPWALSYLYVLHGTSTTTAGKPNQIKHLGCCFDFNMYSTVYVQYSHWHSAQSGCCVLVSPSVVPSSPFRVF